MHFAENNDLPEMAVQYLCSILSKGCVIKCENTLVIKIEISYKNTNAS